MIYLMTTPLLHFGKAVLEKTFYDDIAISLTTIKKIQKNIDDIWETINIVL